MPLLKHIHQKTKKNRKNILIIEYKEEAFSNAVFYPLPSERGFFKPLIVRKSPFGDLGMNKKRRTFETTSSFFCAAI
jgi:hypothetical protein